MSVIFLLVVFLVVVLVMWIIYYIPMPPGSPAFLKNVFYILVLLIALLVIVNRAGWLAL